MPFSKIVKEVVKKRTAHGKRRPKQNGAKKHSEYIKGIKLQICRRAKNYGAIRKAV